MADDSRMVHREIIPDLSITEAGLLSLTEQYKRLVGISGVENVASGKVQVDHLTHMDAVVCTATFDSRYWTGRGGRPVYFYG